MSPAPSPGRLARLADFAFRRRRTVARRLDRRPRRRVRARPRWPATGRPTTRRPGSESRAAADLLAGALPAAAAPTPSTSSGRRRRAPARRRVRRADRPPGRRPRGAPGHRRGARRAAQISRDGTIGVLRIPLDELPGRGARQHRQDDDRRSPQRASGDGAADRARRPGRSPTRSRARSPRRPSASRSRRSSCCSRSARSWRPGCRSPPRCSGSASPRRSSALLAAVTDVPDWAPALAVDARHRRRDRLRAADRHALPRRRSPPGRDRARRVAEAHRDRRPLGADRRHDRRDLAARPVPDGPPLPLRRAARRDRSPCWS